MLGSSFLVMLHMLQWFSPSVCCDRWEFVTYVGQKCCVLGFFFKRISLKYPTINHGLSLWFDKSTQQFPCLLLLISLGFSINTHRLPFKTIILYFHINVVSRTPPTFHLQPIPPKHNKDHHSNHWCFFAPPSYGAQRFHLSHSRPCLFVLDSNKKSTSGSSFFWTSRSPRIVGPFPKPWQFHATIFIGSRRADISVPLHSC